MRLAYIIARYPVVTETFILRELNVVNDAPDIQVHLFATGRAKSALVHPSGTKWLGDLQSGSWAGAIGGAAYWLRRRPLRFLTTLTTCLVGHRRRPEKFLRVLYTACIAGAFARQVRERTIDHVHVHYASYPALAAWVIWRLTGTSYSETVHAHDLFVDTTFLRRHVEQALFVVAISQYNRGFLRAFGGDIATPVHVLHCGVRVPDHPVRRPDGKPGASGRLLCVASLEEYKGHRYLIEALSLLHRQGATEFTLELVGDGPLREELEALAHRLSVGGSVDFRGPLLEDAVRETLARADAFVHPSVIEPRGKMDGIPVALMEALAAGVPAVATDVSGIPELVRDGETGLLVRPRDAEELAQAIRLTFEDVAETRRRVASGRALVEHDFDVERNAGALSQLFVRYLGTGEPASASASAADPPAGDAAGGRVPR